MPLDHRVHWVHNCSVQYIHSRSIYIHNFQAHVPETVSMPTARGSCMWPQK
jgi:hypothetical protein